MDFDYFGIDYDGGFSDGGGVNDDYDGSYYDNGDFALGVASYINDEFGDSSNINGEFGDGFYINGEFVAGGDNYEDGDFEPGDEVVTAFEVDSSEEPDFYCDGGVNDDYDDVGELVVEVPIEDDDHGVGGFDGGELRIDSEDGDGDEFEGNEDDFPLFPVLGLSSSFPRSRAVIERRVDDNGGGGPGRVENRVREVTVQVSLSPNWRQVASSSGSGSEEQRGVSSGMLHNAREIDEKGDSNLQDKKEVNKTASSSGDKKLNGGEVDAGSCPICMEPWTGDGEHSVCCLPCGHLYGMSCIQNWLQRSNSRKCPQCNEACGLQDIRRIYGLATGVMDNELQEKINLLEAKCASLELKDADWSRKETEWRQRETLLLLQLKEDSRVPK